MCRFADRRRADCLVPEPSEYLADTPADDPEVVAEPLLQAADAYSMENPAVGSGGRHGHSTTRADRYDALACVKEITGLLSHVGLDEVIAIGHSYGAIIVSALAVEHPQVARSLMAFDPGHAADDETVALISQLCETMRGTSGLAAAVHAFGTLESEQTSRKIQQWHTRRLLATPPNVLAVVLGGMYKEAPYSDRHLMSTDTCHAVSGPLCPRV